VGDPSFSPDRLPLTGDKRIEKIGPLLRRLLRPRCAPGVELGLQLALDAGALLGAAARDHRHRDPHRGAGTRSRSDPTRDGRRRGGVGLKTTGGHFCTMNQGSEHE